MPMIVLDPTDGPRQQEGKMAVRPGTLDGKVIGVIDNGKRNAGYILSRVVEGLKKKYGIKDAIFEKKLSLSLPIPEGQAEKLAAQCDLVLAGVGD